MKNLLNTQNLIVLGIGVVTAYVTYNILVNKEKAKKQDGIIAKINDNKTSEFCGCGA